jgi:glycosyltransferase involved in cell wall biosynthesis
MSGENADPTLSGFRVLATSQLFEPGFRGGGPIRSVAHIVDTVSDEIELSLITRDRDLGTREPYLGLSGQWLRRGRANIFYLNTHSPRQWLQLWRQLRKVPFDLIYVNSLWDPTFTVLPILAVRFRLIHAARVMIAPRGELSPGALSLKSRKKALFAKWWSHRLNKMDVLWHAFTEYEAGEIRTHFPWAQIVVNQEQVSLPDGPLPPIDCPEGPPRFVFISRISPKKNLDLALAAVGRVSEPIVFDIYGPLENSTYWSKCQALIAQLPRHVRVEYRGELTPANVRRTFSLYDAFVFPTRGENFGHVIAESLSASCPVICSDKTPWTAILEAGGGIVVHDLTIENLAMELGRFAASSPTAKLEKRQSAGRAYSTWRLNGMTPNILEQVRRARPESGC